MKELDWFLILNTALKIVTVQLYITENRLPLSRSLMISSFFNQTTGMKRVSSHVGATDMLYLQDLVFTVLTILIYHVGKCYR